MRSQRSAISGSLDRRRSRQPRYAPKLPSSPPPLSPPPRDAAPRLCFGPPVTVPRLRGLGTLFVRRELVFALDSAAASATPFSEMGGTASAAPFARDSAGPDSAFDAAAPPRSPPPPPPP